MIADDFGRILAKGYHKRAGTDHAEVRALKNLKLARPPSEEIFPTEDDPHGFANIGKGLTLYSTLEPCSHFGRTPPCASHAVLPAGVKRVVIGCLDPDGVESGVCKGVEILRKAGIIVDYGVCERECAYSLRAYFHHRKTKRPWVICKMATSINGMVACEDGTSQWITSSASRSDGHDTLRSTSQAIIVGVGTAIADNPQLNVRYENVKPEPSINENDYKNVKNGGILKRPVETQGRDEEPPIAEESSDGFVQPVRVVLDPSARLGSSVKDVTAMKLCDPESGGHTWVVYDPERSKESDLQWTERVVGVSGLAIPALTVTRKIPIQKDEYDSDDGIVQFREVTELSKDFNLDFLLKGLAKNNCLQVLVEGGGKTTSSFIRQGLCDQLVVYQAPIFLG